MASPRQQGDSGRWIRRSARYMSQRGTAGTDFRRALDCATETRSTQRWPPCLVEHGDCSSQFAFPAFDWRSGQTARAKQGAGSRQRSGPRLAAGRQYAIPAMRVQHKSAPLGWRLSGPYIRECRRRLCCSPCSGDGRPGPRSARPDGGTAPRHRIAMTDDKRPALCTPSHRARLPGKRRRPEWLSIHCDCKEAAQGGCRAPVRQDDSTAGRVLKKQKGRLRDAVLLIWPGRKRAGFVQGGRSRGPGQWRTPASVSGSSGSFAGADPNVGGCGQGIPITGILLGRAGRPRGNRPALRLRRGRH